LKATEIFPNEISIKSKIKVGVVTAASSSAAAAAAAASVVVVVEPTKQSEQMGQMSP